MDKDRLKQIDVLVSRALDAEPEMRDQILMEGAAGDTAVLEAARGIVREVIAEAPTRESLTGVLGLFQPEPINGKYRTIDKLGEGGFGTVYEAEELAPVRRHVAIKVIKPGMDSRAVLARFEAERQALALMSHPCIVKVLDAGLTVKDRPYFVMELIKGIPITDHCARQRSDVRARLELFIRVCEVVQHAHSKGVIHRDLKPGNILVEYEDGKSTPKIIDFGVAKALTRPLTENPVETEHGESIGTLEYMSPEQAEMSSQGVDTLADVYSLGVILYELLTDELPFGSHELRSKRPTEVRRKIREDEPLRPSTKFNSIDPPDRRATIAASRGTDTRALLRTLRGDLDWVVMKCLEKDRERRYDTANALAMDIRRFLNLEPVIAKPPTVAYRAQKFVKRNRAAVFTACAIVLTLLGATVVSTIFAFDAERERRRTAERAQQLRQVADFQAEQLQRIDATAMGLALRAGVLEGARRSWSRANAPPDEIGRRAAQLEQLVAGATFTDVSTQILGEHLFTPTLGAIEKQFRDQPLLKARLLQSVASSLRTLGLLDLAAGPQEEALTLRRDLLGAGDAETLASLNEMGVLMQARGRWDDAEACFREALERRRTLLGPEHPDTLLSMNNIAALLDVRNQPAEAERMHEEVLDLRRRVLGPEHPDTLLSLLNLATVRAYQGRLDEAAPLYSEVLVKLRRVHGDEEHDTLLCINNYGMLLYMQGRLDDARALTEEALATRRRTLGDEHPDTLGSIANMALILDAIGDPDGAEKFYREALDTRRRVLGDYHPETLPSIINLATNLATRGRLAEATPLLEEAVETCRRVHGSDHPDTLDALTNLGVLRQMEGKPVEAALCLGEVLRTREAQLGKHHPATLGSLSRLVRVLIEGGSFAEAEQIAGQWTQPDTLATSPDPQQDPTEAQLVAQLMVELYEAWDAADASAGHAAAVAAWRAKLSE